MKLGLVHIVDTPQKTTLTGVLNFNLKVSPDKYIQKMAEQESNIKYINCTRCKCKYHSKGDNNKVDFGYHRLIERYKTCSKCRWGRKKKGNKR